MPRAPFDCESFEKQHGYDGTTYIAKILVAMAHPDPDRHADLLENSPEEYPQAIAGDETRKQAAIAFAKGEKPFIEVLPYLSADAHAIVRDCAWYEDRILAALRESLGLG